MSLETKAFAFDGLPVQVEVDGFAFTSLTARSFFSMEYCLRASTASRVSFLTSMALSLFSVADCWSAKGIAGALLQQIE